MDFVPHIAVVDDHRDIRDLIGKYLQQQGYRVSTVENGAALRRLLERQAPDLIVLDIMMPGEDGLTLCRELRAGPGGGVPIIFLTALTDETDRVIGLELGADDYVTKPYSSRELVARVRAVLRRQGDQEEPMSATISAGPVRMDVERHVVSVDGEQVSLPLKEFELLEMLLRNAGRVLTRGQLIDRVWGSDYVGDTKTLDVHVKRLRSKIEPDPSSPRYLVTVRGLGYRMLQDPPVG